MTRAELMTLVREQVRKMIESDGYPIRIGRDATSVPSAPVSAGQSKIMALPGAPFGGRLHAVQLSIMPNEAREALKNWAKLCRWASHKHGNPDAWPPLIKQAAIELGRSVEEKVGQPVPGSDFSQNAGNLVY